MNGLVLCTPAHKQPETSAVVPVLDRWVRRTQEIPPETAPNARDCCGR